jgi:hypothetical protein
MDDLEQEELALRRRLLFRLLRGHRFDRPAFTTEAISDLVPNGCITPGRELFDGSVNASQARDHGVMSSSATYSRMSPG